MKYKELIPLVNKILSEYTMRLTLRQIYYRLVADYNYPNKRSSYNQLSSQLVKAREQREVDEDRIEDRTRSFLGGEAGWDNPENFVQAVKDYFLDYWKKYERKLWSDQKYFVIVWVEKDALSRVISRVADKYRVITAPSKGYASYTYIKEAIEKLPNTKEIILLHFSDHDASGLDMTRDLRDRFYRYRLLEGKWSTEYPLRVKRIALTYEQVQQYNLAPNPTKQADPRSKDYTANYGFECWELDAIEPTELQRIVVQAIEKHLDLKQWEKSKKKEEEEKKELEETFDKWREKLESD